MSDIRTGHYFEVNRGTWAKYGDKPTQRFPGGGHSNSGISKIDSEALWNLMQDFYSGKEPERLHVAGIRGLLERNLDKLEGKTGEFYDRERAQLKAMLAVGQRAPQPRGQLLQQLRDIAQAKEVRIAHIYKAAQEAADAIERLLDDYSEEHGRAAELAASVESSELARLREIEHLTWHVLESSEERADVNEIAFALPNQDYTKLVALLGDSHPSHVGDTEEAKRG